MSDPGNLAALTAGWSPEQRAALAERLTREATRMAVDQTRPTAGALAQSIDTTTIQTPAMRVVDDALEHALTTPDARLLVSLPPQQGKLVADHTPVPTPTGWTTHGALRPGDQVIHPSGRPVTVTDVLPSDFATFRMHFGGGDHIDVHPAHEWTLYRDKIPVTIETRQIAAERLTRGLEGKRGSRYRFQLPHREGFTLPEADVPIDPYTLGLWLGDGRSSGAYITHAADDIYQYAYPVTSSWTHPATGAVSDYLGGGFLNDLRSAGLLDNKHVPSAYLRGSEEQRRALLAGLIDSDGYVPQRGQQVTFDNTNRRLVEGVAELARTLGYCAHIHNEIAPATGGVCNGRVVEGRLPTWRVAFSPHDGRQPARLPRYQGRIGADAARRRRPIIRVEEIAPTPGRCITVDSEDGLYLVGRTMIPTHNSTRLSVWGVVRALVQNPARRVVIASYSDALARRHSRAARDIIRGHGATARDPLTGARLPDRLGLALASDHAAATSWRLAGHPGGAYAVGVGGSLTGAACDLLIIDDPHKGMAEADSETERRNVIEWWESVAQTRLAPGAPVVLIMTRWHEHDLAGHVLAQDQALPDQERRWQVVNIPAIATRGVADALDRDPGVPLESTRGHTLEDWQRIRDEVGPRVWAALYCGQPTPSTGGLFSREWFDRYRTPALPDGVAARIVSVDPAETGKGDEAGIIALAATADGVVHVTDDRSGRMQSDEWARAAVTLALETAATEVLFEAFTTGPTYERVIRNAWTEVRADPPTGVAVPDQDDPPFHIRPWRARGDKTARAAGTRQAASTGRLRMVGTHPALEGQAVAWQQGQASPDRLDATVNGFERCVQIVGANSLIAVPTPPASGPTAPSASPVFTWGASIPTGL